MPVELGVFQHTSRTIAFHSPLKTVGHVMLSGSPRGGEARDLFTDTAAILN